MKNETIKLITKFNEEANSGILTVLHKTKEFEYDALAIAVINKKCYEQLKKLEGEYTKK